MSFVVEYGKKRIFVTEQLDMMYFDIYYVLLRQTKMWQFESNVRMRGSLYQYLVRAYSSFVRGAPHT